jgi:hypothetical protein
MKKIQFKKIYKYDPTFEGKYSKYQGYKLITLQKNSPGILPGDHEAQSVRFKKVFTSSLLRGAESGKYISNKININHEKTKDLNEIKFDLEKLLSEEEFNNMGSNLVRQRFIESFIKDSLNESRKNIKTRILRLLKRINGLENGYHLFICHSFFMKIFQIYLMDNSLFENPKIVHKYFDPTKKTFEFGEGFEFIIQDDGKIKFNSYLS